MKEWKVMMEKYESQTSVCNLEDIYGGGEGGQECIVCMSDKANTMVKPCKHLCLCQECSKVIKDKTNACPICRKKMTELVTIAID